MKKKSTSQLRHQIASTRIHSVSAPVRRSLGEGGFFNLRVLLASIFCLVGAFAALLGSGAFSNLFAQTTGIKQIGVADRSAAPLTAWEKQAPYPTRFAANGVDVVSATEAWAVAYTDILHTTDGGVTWENQPRPGFQNLYAVDFFDNQHGIAMGNTTLYTRDGGATWTRGGLPRLRRCRDGRCEPRLHLRSPRGALCPLDGWRGNLDQPLDALQHQHDPVLRLA